MEYMYDIISFLLMWVLVYGMQAARFTFRAISVFSPQGVTSTWKLPKLVTVPPENCVAVPVRAKKTSHECPGVSTSLLICIWVLKAEFHEDLI